MAAAGVFRGAYTTAYHTLLQRGRLQQGEWVLVHRAVGGIGMAAIQVAKAFGAKVSPRPGAKKNAARVWMGVRITQLTIDPAFGSSEATGPWTRC
jgi:NADPH2:quinone reductase